MIEYTNGAANEQRDMKRKGTTVPPVLTHAALLENAKGTWILDVDIRTVEAMRLKNHIQAMYQDKKAKER